MGRTAYTFVRLLLVGGLAVALAPIVSAFSVVTVPVGINPGMLAVIPQTGEIAVVNHGSNDVFREQAGRLSISSAGLRFQETRGAPAAVLDSKPRATTSRRSQR